MNRILFFLLVILFPFPLRAQIANTFNLDINNGLPSNRVYWVTKDSHGYLWIATEKGVVRYNGYEYKTFDIADGLPNADVWELFEDKKGRIWVGSISDDIGYIYNGKYHKAVLRNFKNMIYPSIIRNLNNDIFFTTLLMRQPALCIESNDTITNYPISDSLYAIPYYPNPIHYIRELSWYSSKTEYLLLYCDSILYKIELNNKKISLRQILNTGDAFFHKTEKNQMIIVNNHIISYPLSPSSTFITIDLSCGKIRENNIKSYGNYGELNYICPDRFDSTFYVITDHNILQFKSGDDLSFLRSLKIDDLVPGNKLNGNKIRPVYNDAFWGMCIGTTNNGLWTNYNIKNKFIPKTKVDLNNYVYLGGIDDSVFYWWNNDKSTFALFGKDLKPTYCVYKNIHAALTSIVRYNNDSLILSGSINYFLNKKSKEINELMLDKASSIITEKPGSIVATTLNGVKNAKYIRDSGYRLIVLEKKRYNGLIYDSIRKNFLAYNNDNVFIHNADKNKDTLISKEKLFSFGLAKIEKIIIDNKYGNIFFQGDGKITMYDCEKNTYNKLFQKYNLKEASVFIKGSTLIVTGRFGILFSKITGRQQISQPLLYPNIKNINYRFIYDCQVSSKNILLNTDKGVYAVDIPSESEILQQRNDSITYKFILNYKDSVTNRKTGDTIIINQKDLRLQFDVINPLGNGKVKYRYQLSGDTTWHELNANELTLPSLPPDNYYVLSIIVNDDSWRSDSIDLYFYIQPYWWQTNTGRKMVWAGVILLIILLLTTSVIITRKLVLRATTKRNMQMELELKAIYAQMNPHFIFNTLNTAFLLVRKKRFEEASTHILQFSRLLRSYIKSSRNKLIAIADEITNLEDYLELQKTRFGNKFEYTILVDAQINPQNVKIPSLLLQPFVENALNHGLLPKQEPGHLKIEFVAGVDKNEIICRIDDDGIGRKQARLEDKDSGDKEESYGDLLIKDLVNIFNKYEQMNIVIRYTDKEEPLTGTTVTIHIKNPRYG